MKMSLNMFRILQYEKIVFLKSAMDKVIERIIFFFFFAEK